MFNSRRNPALRRGAGAAALLAAFGLGAAAMYLLDPASGTRRRERLARRFGAAERVDDAILVDRVRGAFSRTIPGAEAVDIRVRDGRVALRGPVRAAQVGELLACASRVAGVRSVENYLSPSDL